MLSVYTTATNNRIEYLFNQVLSNLLGLEVHLTTSIAAFKEAVATQAGINYSTKDLGVGLWVYPHALLFETDIQKQNLELGSWQQLPSFFLQEQGDIPFDLFAASFYLLSRYEEYLPHQKDQHGRFRVEDSLAFQEGFLDIPLVDFWMLALRKLLEKQHPLPPKPRRFKLISTLDIDHPYLYRNKGLIKNMLGAWNDLYNCSFDTLKERICCLLHLQPDPYLEAIQFIVSLHNKLDKELYAFIHVGPYGKYDRRTLYSQRRFYTYLRSVYNVKLGLHPSYQAAFSATKTAAEKNRLEKILGYPVHRSRQHFLRFSLPQTYHQLHSLGIDEDFSLGYASEPGFRASTSYPYPFFDLTTNQASRLVLRPTIIMDTTLLQHKHKTEKEAEVQIKKLLLQSYRAGGQLVVLWHNSNLTQRKHAAWRGVMSEIVLFGLDLEG